MQGIDAYTTMISHFGGGVEENIEPGGVDVIIERDI